MQACESAYSSWKFSGGFRTWVKMSLVETKEEDGREAVEFRQEVDGAGVRFELLVPSSLGVGAGSLAGERCLLRVRTLRTHPAGSSRVPWAAPMPGPRCPHPCLPRLQPGLAKLGQGAGMGAGSRAPLRCTETVFSALSRPPVLWEVGCRLEGQVLAGRRDRDSGLEVW